jgi:N-acetylmuramoyl-L-alanine amidase
VGEERFPLEARPESDRHRVSIPGRALEAAYCGEDADRCLRFAEAPSVELRFAAAVDGDTARLGRELRLRVLEPDALPVAELREAPDRVHGQNGRVVGRPSPHGPYAWRFPDGTRAEVTGRLGDRLRLAVPGGAPAWVDVEDAVLLPVGARRPRATTGDLAVEPEADRLRLGLPLTSAVPVTVSRPDPRRLRVRLHGVRAGAGRISYGPADPLLEEVDWSQAPGPTMELELGLSEPLWGYELRWIPGATGAAGEADVDGGTRLVLEIRRPPAIDPEDPLRGRTVAVDPGHPGAGAYGPTGHYEGDANLAIARRLADMLRERGARPVLIRDDTLPVGLYERTNRAVEAGAELFVSIHNNALPDGVHPFGQEGTSTYYYHSHARELAESVQTGMLLHMGLRDLGMFWGNLAVTRLSWMPSVLAEGAFMMMPRHEAALKTVEFQRAYARGVLTGIEGFLARRARDGAGRGTTTREEP